MPDPVLRTERLVLVPLVPDLARRLLAGPVDGLPAAAGFPRPDDLTVLQAVLTSADSRSDHDGPGEADRPGGTWLVSCDGVLVGTVGAVGPVSPEGDQEIGYGLVAAARGNGVGTEAVGAMCAVLERRDGVRRLTAEVLPGNEASLRLLRRLGFVEVDGGQCPSLRLARAAPGSPALQPEVARRRRIVGRHVC